MPFNISEFKAQIDRLGGPARASIFDVSVFNPPVAGTGVDVGNFRFFCQSATVPSITFDTATYTPVGAAPVQYPTGVQPQVFNAIFMMDSEHQLLTFFHRWMQNVVNYGTTAGRFSEVGGKLPFELGYMEDYGARLSVKHYTTGSNESRFYEVIMDNAYPVAIGDVELSWSDNDSFLTLPVSFAFDRIEYSGELEGSPIGAFGRGSGLLDLIGAVAGFVGVVQQTVKQQKPTSIQDAINRIYRVRGSLDRLNNVLG